MKKLILFGAFFILFLGLTSATTFTPIFCNDYEFTCCGGQVESSDSYLVTDEISWACPEYSYTCIILSKSNDDVDWYVGEGNCKVVKFGLFAHRIECDYEEQNKKEMSPNEEVYVRGVTGGYGDVESYLQIKIIRPKLGFCGRSGSSGEQTTCGVSVSGADGCEFSPNEGVIYESTDSLSGKIQTSSYTVPIGECILAFQSGDRHICGYKEESCSSNSDCDGHTYGNQECIGRKLQTYGCRDYGTSLSEKDRGPFDSGWGVEKSEPQKSGDADFGKRCEITKAEDVQCCGDTDCGTDFFCDIKTFTCQEQVECNKDVDCGVSVQCDWNSKKLKTPYCANRKCSFVEKDVECCLDKNCAEGSYCGDDNKCSKKTASYVDEKQKEESKGSSGITGAVIGGGNKVTPLGIVLSVLIAGGLGFFAVRYLKGRSSIGSAIICSSCGTSTTGSKFCTNCGEGLLD